MNKNIVKQFIDNVKEMYPGVAEDLVPEKISYLQIEDKLKEKLMRKESIQNLIGILEEMERSL